MYCATKHGVVGFTRSLKVTKGRVFVMYASDLILHTYFQYWGKANNIRVNCLCPFIADTELGRVAIDTAKTFNPAMFKDGLVTYVRHNHVLNATMMGARIASLTV